MYRRDDMKAAAEARGWLMTDWFRVAGVNRWSGYDFMKGKTNSARTAEKLTRALGRRPGFYQIRQKRSAA